MIKFNILRPFISINVHSVILTYKSISINTLTTTTVGLLGLKLLPYIIIIVVNSIYFSVVGNGYGGGAINSTLYLTTLKQILQ